MFATHQYELIFSDTIYYGCAPLVHFAEHCKKVIGMCSLTYILEG